jgi:lambda repressor-like predicted transcriptional regulator
MDAATQLVEKLQGFGESYRELSDRTGVGKMTLHGFLNNDTSKCKFATIQAIAKSLGYEVVLKKAPKAK